MTKRKIPEPDSSSALFLDRDGVLNEKIEGDYVREVSQLKILPGVPEAIALLRKRFSKIFVVTNQQGIGKGLFTEQSLEKIHSYIIAEIEKAGGKIDGIYFCPHLALANCNCRKPKTGLAEQAKKDFPEINFKKSFLVGDADSDIQMGKALGMRTVLIGKSPAGVRLKPDFVFESLLAFTDGLKESLR